MHKLPIVSIALLFCLVLPACSTAAPTMSPTATPLAVSPPLSMEAYPVAVPPVASLPSPTPSIIPANQFTATLQPLEDTPVLAVEPCSPLVEHTLAELPEIVSAPYNPPPMGSDARHQGVDFSYYRRGERTSILGVGVQTVFAGRVASSITDSFPYGNVVIVETPASTLPPGLVEQLAIQDGESLYTLYAHMGAAPLVTLGDLVTACQSLGEVGKSGNAGVPHLHLEMRLGPASQKFAAMAFYSTQTTQEARDNYTLWRMSGEFRHLDPVSVLIP